jgi:hypothetical protein
MRLPVAILALSISLAGAGGELAEHQRIAVEIDRPNRLEAGFGCAWLVSAQGFVAECEASLEYAWRKALSVGLILPWTISRSTFLLGDPGATLAYLWRREALRLQAGLGYSYPIHMGGERGFHRFSPSLSLSVVRDPVILGWGADFASSLPREEGGYLVWPAFFGSLSFSFWELLNDRISYRVAVSPGLSLGELRIGAGERPIPAWSLEISLAVSWDERRWGLRGGWSGASPSGSGAFDLRALYRQEW